MIALIRLFLGLLVAPFRSKSSLEAENAALRQQIIVLRRKLHGRVKLSNGERLFFVWLYRMFPSVRRAILIIGSDNPMATRWLSPLLALEVTRPHRPTAGRARASGLDPAHQRREPPIGCAAHPW